MVSIPSVAGVATGVGRSVLLPPLRLVREASVAVARTARHWELVVAGEDPHLRARLHIALDDERLHGVEGTTAGPSDRAVPQPSPAPAPSHRPPAKHDDEPPAEPVGADALDLRDLDSDDLPVEDWPQLSFADAQARASGCTRADLQLLLAYEQEHGHRLLFERMLQDRLAHAG